MKNNNINKHLELQLDQALKDLDELQKENELLKKKNKMLFDYGDAVGERRNELYDRIEKAIEHCKSNMFVDSQFIYEQLEILGDKE